MDEGDYCWKISTNFQLGTRIVLSSIEFFFIARVKDHLHDSENWPKSPFDRSNFVHLSSTLRMPSCPKTLRKRDRSGS